MPGSTEPGKNLYFRRSDAQTLCKVFYYPEPHSPPEESCYSSGKETCSGKIKCHSLCSIGGLF